MQSPANAGGYWSLGSPLLEVPWTGLTRLQVDCWLCDQELAVVACNFRQSAKIRKTRPGILEGGECATFVASAMENGSGRTSGGAEASASDSMECLALCVVPRFRLFRYQKSVPPSSITTMTAATAPPMIAPVFEFELGLEGTLVIIGAIHFMGISVRWTRVIPGRSWVCFSASVVIDKVIKLVNSSQYLKSSISSRKVVSYQ